ncbi:MAG: carboxypeptidase regulatory-like domain-containing protein [Deltaproteobacteria bacterium]|nr:carboxypeptidase regulatory-like domain-containing protein [Deltaproteobacteria bacterium]
MKPVALVRGFLLSLALFAACDDDWRPVADAGGTPPAGDGRASDAARGDLGPLPLDLPSGGAGHARVDETLGAGQVRAGRVTDAAQLLSGVKVRGRVGDYRLYNARVAFIVQDGRRSDGIGTYGGQVVDAVRLGQAGEQARSLLGEMIFGVGTQTVRPTSVGVIADGSDGKAAVVRVIGEPVAVPVFASFALGKLPPCAIVMDYVLEPESDALEIRWRVINRHRTTNITTTAILGVLAGDGADFFMEGVGFDTSSTFPGRYVGMIARSVGYALVPSEGQVTPLVVVSGTWLMSNGEWSIPAAGESVRRYRLVVSDGTPDAVLRGVRSVLGQPPLAELSGRVLSGTTPVAEARVHLTTVESPPKYVTGGRTDAKGDYRVAVGPGTYRVTAVADGRAPSVDREVRVETSGGSADLSVGESSRVTFTVSDVAGADLPAKVIAMPNTKPRAFPASFGERAFPAGAAQVAFYLGGTGELALPPGEYRLTASRGFEYELDEREVTAASGAPQAVAFRLTRSVDTRGYMSGDFHVHAMWSPDSSDLYELKVSALAAEGVELPVCTEHEYVGDYGPTIAKLGLQRFVRGVVGEEITSFVYGHFNPFPIEADPSLPNRGALVWYELTPPAVFAEVRRRWPQAVLQVNHPRAPAMAYFTYVGYDPLTGQTRLQAEWSTAFDAVEVFNGSGWRANRERTVADWFSLLERGLRVTATGNSDSHNAFSAEVGYPRNYVKLSTDEPAAVSLEELARSVKAQRVAVSGGIFVTAEAEGKGLGELVRAEGGKVKLAIKVQAPRWVPAEALEVIVGGVTAKRIELGAATQDPSNPVVRYQGTVELEVTRDTWVVVVATGTGTLDPVVRGGEPFGLTNPIYVDADGNGSFTPSKSFP